MRSTWHDERGRERQWIGQTTEEEHRTSCRLGSRVETNFRHTSVHLTYGHAICVYFLVWFRTSHWNRVGRSSPTDFDGWLLTRTTKVGRNGRSSVLSVGWFTHSVGVRGQVFWWDPVCLVRTSGVLTGRGTCEYRGLRTESSSSAFYGHSKQISGPPLCPY